MKKKLKNQSGLSVFLLLLMLIVLSACNHQASFKPREVNTAIDACEVCNMSIAHSDYATQLIEKDGTVHMYDDIGCMVEYLKGKGKEKDIAAKFVRDNKTLDWVPMEKAFYAYDPAFWTPMAYGVVPFSVKDRAEEYIAKEGKGKVIDYKGLDNMDWTMNNQ